MSTMDDNDTTEDESMPLSPSKNDSLDLQIKFDLRPVWQSATYYYAHAVLKIIDKINTDLKHSSEHLKISVLNTNFGTKPRLTPMVYFTGLLISNFHPNSSEVDETIELMEELFRNVENEAVNYLKNLKKLSSGIESFTKSLVKEMKRPNYEAFSDDKPDDTEKVSFEGPTFQKYPGVWLELINSEKETLYLQSREIASVIRIPTNDLEQKAAFELGKLLLAEIQETVQKASAELNKIQLTPEVLKAWKSTSTDFVSSIKLIRKAQNFGGDNCAPELKNTLSDILWKLHVISLRIQDLRIQTVWLLKGVQCVRRKTGNWAPGQVPATPPEVNKHISPPLPKLSKLLRCFQNRPEEYSINFVKMFSDIGNTVGEGFVLDVAIPETMKETLFKGNLAVTVEPCDCETLPKVDHVSEVGLDSEQVVVDLENSDADTDEDDEDLVIMDSVETAEKAQSTNDQSPISGTIQQNDSQIEVDVLSISADEQKSDLAELPVANVVENTTTVDPGFEDDAVSTTSSSNPFHFQSLPPPPPYSENPGKSLSEEKRDNNPSVEKVSTNEGKAEKNKDKTQQGKAKPRGQYFTPDF